ncbi:hypothetical protein RM543_01380 [Roseicyclus sp. F158]|uniref:Lipoprotein n=1 Tax=Tropicimonas omnivorans TaxID=3075590 RepID=A0ABU3DC79_9RHOB|nr:hypothetical protein [Roseicyclus sp. F158]MDT0681319.1 hypothetical protein [Roseicyclus sp. F158]
MARLAPAARRLLAALLLPLALAACGAEPVWAPAPEVQRAAYTHPGPKTLTLFTVINNRSNEGAHTGLMVSADQRAIFDPAGTFKSPALPERNDVHYGMTPRAEEIYIDYHARQTHHVVKQEVQVTPEQAAIALRLIEENGAAPKAYCASATSGILKQIPGFESINSTFFPRNLMRQFADVPGVVTTRIYDDSEDNRGALRYVPG